MARADASMQSKQEFRRLYGWADLSPKDLIEAGSIGSWTVTYHVGRYGIDDSGMVRVARRFVSDWGKPQDDCPEGLDYIRVSTSGQARVRARYDAQSHVRPWQKAVTIYVDDGHLGEGETVTLRLGDTSGGSPGTTAQTFCEPRFELKVLVDCFGTGAFVELESVGTVEIVSGPASELQLILPSDVEKEKPFRVSLKALDQWGNPATTHEGKFRFTQTEFFEGLPDQGVFRTENQGILHFEDVRAKQEGVYWIEADDPDRSLSVLSNGLTVHAETPVLRRFWGDLHGQSEETVGTKSVDEYFAFARDQACVDFAGHQGNCFQITQATWELIRKVVRHYHEPERFVTFLGYEWSGLTSAGGDRNIYYLGDDGPLHRCSHWLVSDASDVDSDCYPVTELYRRLRGRKDVLIVSHVGGRYSDLRFHDPALEPLVEIYSSWGEFEWLLEQAFEQGCRVGITCGSDDHKGRPGASYPGSSTFGVRGGLVCVYASELTREAIWESLWKRRCYGTTGQRIGLQVETDAGVPMGGEALVSRPPTFQVQIAGTDDVERVELRRGLHCVDSAPSTSDTARSQNAVRISWRGARNKGRKRAARWDGSIECQGTKIEEAHGYAFDSPAEGIREINQDEVLWESVTTGDADGIVLRLNPPDQGVLRFVTNVTSFELALEDLSEDPIVYPAGGERLEVRVEREPLGLGRSVRVDLRDDQLSDTPTPYHVMVLQRDGAKAWSSPIWVSKGTPESD